MGRTHRLLRAGTSQRCSGRAPMAALGTRRRAQVQLLAVTCLCCSGRVPMAALGTRIHARLQLVVVTCLCCSGRAPMAALQGNAYDDRVIAEQRSLSPPACCILILWSWVMMPGVMVSPDLIGGWEMMLEPGIGACGGWFCTPVSIIHYYYIFSTANARAVRAVLASPRQGDRRSRSRHSAGVRSWE